MNLLILAAEAPAQDAGGGVHLIIPQLYEIFWGALAFLILFVVLWKYAVPALRKSLQQRSETIQNDLKRAEEAKLEAEQVLSEYREQLANARTEAARIIEDSRRTADEMRQDILAKSEVEAREIVEAGKREVQAAVLTAQADMRRQMADLSVDLAGRVIGRQLDPAAQAQIIDQFIRELDATEAPR